MTVQLQNLVLAGQAIEISNEEIASALDRFKRLDVPDIMGNSIINIDEDVDGSIVMFSSEIPEAGPIAHGDVNLLVFDVEDGQLSVSADIDPEYLSEFEDLFDEILDEISLHMTGFDANFTIDRPFSELNVSIEGPEEFDYRGVRFLQSDFSFIVQDVSEFSWHSDGQEPAEEVAEETDEHMSAAAANSIEHYDVEESGEFIGIKTDQCQEILEKLL